MNAVDLAVTNARVYTGEPAESLAEAFACAGGRVVAIGSESDVGSWKERARQVLDLRGLRVIPGFVDAHVHLIFSYQLGNWVDLGGRPSLAEVQRRVRAFARAHPDEPAVVGHGFDYAALKPDGLPDRRDLDAAVADRPVLLTSWDGHTGWANSRLVDRALAYFRAEGREMGEPERDVRSGDLTGIFRRSFDLELPELRARRSVDDLRRTLAEAASRGITTAFDVQVPLEDLSAYTDLLARDELPIRMRVALYHPRGTDPARYAEFRTASDRWGDDRLRVGAVKLYIDGVQETHTAALLDPYVDRPGERGETLYAENEFHEIVRNLDAAGFQILTHACGDRGVRIALDAYEAAARTNGSRERRHRIEHCENIAPEDRPRFARLGVIPCMMPRHSSVEFTDRWRETMGDARWRDGFLWRELVEAGARLAFASDWPVSDLNPLVNLAAAVGRRDLDGTASPHRLTVAEALEAYTRGAAYASFGEADRGTLAVGKFADFAVLSADPFDEPPERFGEIRVLLTAVGGRVVHAEGPFAAARAEPLAPGPSRPG